MPELTRRQVSPPPGSVILGPTRPGGSRAPLPQETVDRDGTAFTVRRRVDWVDDPQTSKTRDYKRLGAFLSWTNAAQQHSLAVKSIRAPSADEESASDFVLASFSVSPKTVQIDDAGNPSQSLTLSAKTTSAAASVQVSFRQRGDTTDTVAFLTTTDARTWSLTRGGRFPNGDVRFTFTATRTTPTADSVSGVKLVRFLQAMAVAPITLSPASACLLPAAVTPDIVVDVHGKGLVAEDLVEVSWATNPPKAAAHVATTTDGADFCATIPGDSYSDSMVVTVRATRVATGETATGQATFTVTRLPVCL